MFVVKDGQADGDELRSAYRMRAARSRKENTKLPTRRMGYSWAGAIHVGAPGILIILGP